MLQTLLADRFQMHLHRESRSESVYRLTVARNGPKLKAAEPCAGEPTADNPCGGFAMDIRGLARGRNVSMSQVTLSLSRIFMRVVIDETGLTGAYDIDLSWLPDQNTFPTLELPPNSALAPDAPNIFTAIEEQLGLRLESGRAPVDVIVIDRAERPSEN